MIETLEALALKHPLVLSVITITGSAIIASIVSTYKNRIRSLGYTVHHERVGISAEDNVFGNVIITWQGTPVQNLFLSTITLQNNMSRDINNFNIKAYTSNQTRLLNQSTQIQNTAYIVELSEEFSAKIRVPDGATPTQLQIDTYAHNREFHIPVLNRNDRIIIQFLNTTTQGMPSIWLDTRTSGLKLKYRPNMPEIHGVQVRVALPLGLIACVLILLTIGLFIKEPWIVGLACMIVGLVAQSIGASIFKLGLLVRRLFDY